MDGTPTVEDYMGFLAGYRVRDNYAQVCLFFISYADEHCDAGTRLELVNIEDFSGKAHTSAPPKPSSATDDATDAPRRPRLRLIASHCW